MSGIKTSTFQSPIEQQAYAQRLQVLGLKVNSDGTIDESSAQRLALGNKSGLAALQAVIGADGVLSAEAAAQLSAKRRFLSLTAKDSTISEKESNAMIATASAMEGAASSLVLGADRLSRNVPVDEESLKKLGRDLSNLDKQWSPWAGSGASLANLSPKALEKFVSAFEALSAAATAYGSALSERREALLRGGATGQELAEHGLLTAMSGVLRPLEVVRDATILVLGREKTEESAAPPPPPQSIGDMTQELAAALTKDQIALKESLDAKGARIMELVEKTPGLINSSSVEVLSSLLVTKFPTLEAERYQGTGPALHLWSFDIPTSFAPPNGPQQLVITAQGLRAVGASGETRPVDASQLAAAGTSWAQLEKALANVLDTAVHRPDKLEVITVGLNKEDRLYPNGSTRSYDPAAFAAEWAQATTLTDPKALTNELIRVVNEYSSTMTAGEFRDFAGQVLDRMAALKLPAKEGRLPFLVELHKVISTLGEQSKRFPFYNSNLTELVAKDEAARKVAWGSVYEEKPYVTWLHAGDAFRNAKYY